MDYEHVKSMAMRDMYIDSDCIYFSNHTFNALIAMNKENGEFQFVKSFNKDEFWMKGLHRRVIKYRKSLFFFPDASKGITKYNLDTREMDFFKSNEKVLDLADAILFGKNVYLIPKSINQPLYLFDMENYCYESKDSWNSMIMEKVNVNTEIMIWPPCTIGRTIWVLLKDLNVVIETSIDNWKLEFYCFERNILFDSITSDGENIWLASGTNDVVICWNKDRGVIKEYVLSDFRSKKSVRDISRLIFIQDRIVVLPKKEKEIFVINLTGSINVITLPHLQHVSDPARGELFPLFSGCTTYDGEVYLLPWAADKMYKLNLDTYDITEFDTTFKDVKSYYINILRNSETWQDINPIIEDKRFYRSIDLNEYLYIIINDSWDYKQNVDNKEIYGCNIYDLMDKGM